MSHINLSIADDPKSVIIDAARRLDHAAVPQHLFGIQFAQIGDEEDATEALRELDDDLEHEHGIRVGSLLAFASTAS